MFIHKIVLRMISIERVTVQGYNVGMAEFFECLECDMMKNET